MEDPATWGKAEHIVADVIKQAVKARAEGMVGLSMVRQITDALREAGLLAEDEPASPAYRRLQALDPEDATT